MTAKTGIWWRKPIGTGYNRGLSNAFEGIDFMKCDECGVGRCQPVNLPYIRSLGSRVMVLPNAPASKCDMCGQVRFDPRFEYTLQFMLDQLVESPNSSKIFPQAVPEPLSAWSNVSRRG